MAKYSAQNGSPKEEAHQLIIRAFRLAVENLHLVVCGLDVKTFNAEDAKKRQILIDELSSLIAKHLQSDLATAVKCEECYTVVNQKIREFPVHQQPIEFPGN